MRRAGLPLYRRRMDEERPVEPPEVLVASSSRRVSGALRALLEASTGWTIREVAVHDLGAEVTNRRPLAVLLDLTASGDPPPALPGGALPPLVGLSRTPVPSSLQGRLDAQVGIDDGIDAIVDAIRDVSR
jgi:hypothetical protein